MPIKDLLAAHRVSIFFHGHDHFFAQQSRDCLTYQETPQPGHPNFNNAGQADDYGYLSGVILPNSGHLRVTVSPERTNVEYVRAYKTANETSTRRNKDVSAQYSIAAVNCYDSVTSSVPVIWNAAYANEMIVPNPSSTQMSIGLSCPVDDLVSITIVDEIGRPCRQLLVNSIVPQGEHYVLWDGRDDRGSMLPAGTYTAIIVGTHHGWHSLPLIRIK
jgi:hypothetical protein